MEDAEFTSKDYTHKIEKKYRNIFIEGEYTTKNLMKIKER